MAPLAPLFDDPRLLAFLFAGLALNVTPGPDMLYVLARSVGQGPRAGTVSALGICVGGLGHALAAAFGLSAILMTSAVAFGIVKYAGAAYLIYLGAKMILSGKGAGGLSTASGEHRSSLVRVFGRGIFISLLNPKVALFFLAFLPQFVNPERGSVALQCLVLGAVFNTTGMAVNVGVALLGGRVGAFMRRHPKAATYQEKTTGAICIALGLRLATANRR